MTVKEKRGRRRYIAFTLDKRIDKTALVEILSAISSGRPYVIQCSEGWAIIRTSPEERDATIDIMTKANINAVSLSTSGTLRALRAKYPKLQATRPPARS